MDIDKTFGKYLLTTDWGTPCIISVPTDPILWTDLATEMEKKSISNTTKIINSWESSFTERKFNYM